METKKRFRPHELRTLLAVLFVAIVLGGAVGFYWGLDMVRQYAHAVNQQLADADKSGDQIQELQSLRNQLSQSTALIEQANLMFATPTTYQSQAINDIENAANAAGVDVASTNFSDSEASTLSVTLNQPVQYGQFIQFLTNIEGNLPKLQVTSLVINQSSNPNAGTINVGEIKIKVAVR